MDIRKFFKGSNHKREAIDGNHGEKEEKKAKLEPAPCAVESVPGPSFASLSAMSSRLVDECYENDLGEWLGSSSKMTREKKKELLTCCWQPSEKYDFSKDVEYSQRKFCYSWLNTYSPWLTYSKKLRGGLCKYCVLFPPATGTVKGVLGSFIVKPFQRFKHMHDSCNNHASSQWHKAATNAAKAFMDEISVDLQMVTGHQKLVEENKKILLPIISTVIFCGTHDLPLRGKDLHEGVFEDLIKFRIDAGDRDLKRHIEKNVLKKNATYMSPQIQNEIVDLCGAVVKDCIIGEAKKASAFSVLADETADVSGKEQLSVGLRFFDNNRMEVREEFVGFIQINALDATTIATAIDRFLENEGLDPNKCVGQGYDGCSAMAGQYQGVQAIIRNKYKLALFFHCASHKLNLVVNDLNSVQQVRNSVCVIKDIIRFFRESVLRRPYAPNIPLFCETRWSQKYKSIAIFYKHFVKIVEGLERLSVEGNPSTRNQAFQLHAAATKSQFIIAVALISKYSALLEPVVNALQAENLDLAQCLKHIKRIIELIRSHCKNVDEVSTELVDGASKIAEDLEIDLAIPRSCQKQTHRSNPPALSPNGYWKRSLVIPYLDSLVCSLETRFSDEHSPAFSLLVLHPFNMLEMTITDFQVKSKEFMAFYELTGFASESELWYNMWRDKQLSKDQLRKLDLADLVKEADIFYPATKKALLIAISLPCTMCTVERSFSTLRRVKTWLRSTMTGQRLNGLCLMSVHRKTFKENKDAFENDILKRFSANPRKLTLV